MVKRRKIQKDTPVGIVDETEIYTDSGLVKLTNSHLGNDVYEITVTSEHEGVIERFGEMTRERAWGVYSEKCRYYEGGANPVSGGNSIIPEDLEDGWPPELIGLIDY